MGNMDIYCGVDIGATKIMIGLISGKGEVIKSEKFSTESERYWKTIVDEIVVKIQNLCDNSQVNFEDVSGIGMGCPGTLDRERKFVYSAPNLGWKDVSLYEYMKSKIRIPLYIENDTNLSTMGVSYFGEGKSAESVFGIFVGTGIGGGFVVKGDLFTGYSGTSGEIGHMVIQKDGPLCGCGNHGCLEASASRSSVYKNLIKGLKSKEGNKLSSNNYDDIEEDETLFIKKSYLDKEPFARTLVNEAARDIGIAVANVMNLINPEMFVFGGALIEALGDELVPLIKETALSTAMPGSKENVKFIRTVLGDRAPMLGGAALVMTHLK